MPGSSRGVTGRGPPAGSPSLARSRSSSPFQATAHGMRDVLPGGTARPSGRRALLVDGVKELIAICHRDPGVAHPDVELALVFLDRIDLPSVCQHPRTFMICLSRLASVRSATQHDTFL